MITSKDNEKLKSVRKLNARRRDRDHMGLFVAEGEDLIAAADAAGWEASDVLTAAGCGLPGIEVVPELLRQVTELNSGTRQLGIYRQRWGELQHDGLSVYLHGVGDPGNVGTILRSAAAFGASRVILGPGSADPFSPKAVRASMGAIFQVPVVRSADDGDELLLGAATTVALDAAAAVSLAEIAADLDPGQPLTLLVGAEREGLPRDLQAGATHVAKIPIATESLNAGVAAAVALYELTRDPAASTDRNHRNP
jgi:RNA methyltransferase, TrmH family